MSHTRQPKSFAGFSRTKRISWLIGCFSAVIPIILIMLISTVPARSNTPPDDSSQTVLKDTLKNGLRVVIVKNSLAPTGRSCTGNGRTGTPVKNKNTRFKNTRKKK